MQSRRRCTDRGLAAHRLLFVPTYGEVVIPKRLRGVASWLALWDRQIVDRILELEPELLLSGGDPEGFDLEDRIKLLRAVVERHSAGHWRGLEAPLSEIDRLSDPSLSGEVRALWGRRGTNPEIAEILLKVMGKGPMPDCRDLMASAARDPDLSAYARILAIRGLRACNDVEELRLLAADMIARPDDWPRRIIDGVVGVLYPGALDEAGLARLVGVHDGRGGDGISMGLALKGIAESAKPATEAAHRLLSEMAALLAEEGDYSTRLIKRTAHPVVAKVVAILCAAEVRSGHCPLSDDVIGATLLLRDFARYDGVAQRETDKLIELFTQCAPHRLHLLLAATERARRTHPEWDGWRIRNHARLGELTRLPDDRNWLLRQAQDHGDEVVAEALFFLLIGITPEEDRTEQFWDDLGTATSARSRIHDQIDGIRNSPPRDLEDIAFEQKIREIEETNRREEAFARRTLSAWRAGLVNDPERLLQGQAALHTLRTIHRDPEQCDEDSSGSWIFFKRDRLAGTYGPHVAEAVGRALRRVWRELRDEVKTLPSTLGSTPWERIVALNGLVAEAEQAGWAERLTEEEFEFAVRMAGEELNGFAPFLDDLVDHDAGRTAGIVMTGIVEELQGPQGRHLRWTYGAARQGGRLSEALAPMVRERIIDGEADDLDGNALRELFHLAKAGQTPFSDAFVDAVERRASPESNVASPARWIAILAEIDPARAARVLERFASASRWSVSGMRWSARRCAGEARRRCTRASRAGAMRSRSGPSARTPAMNA